MTTATFEAFDTKIRPFRALAAVIRMLRDKEATHEVYRITASLDGPNVEQGYQRFKSTELGARILAEKHDLLETLSDHDALRQMPEGSLGRAYMDFITREGLSAQGFQDEMNMSGERFKDAGEDRQRFMYRMRHTHDLFHVLTTYGRDLIGELSLLAFTQAFTGSRGIALLIFFGSFKARKEYPGMKPLTCIFEGRRLGKQAAEMFGADWEALLEKPVAEVRQMFNIGYPEEYHKISGEAANLDREYRAQLEAGRA